MKRMLAVCATIAALDCAAAAAPDAGKTIAMKGSATGAPPCTSCHGAQGEGNAAAGFPRLAALGQSYFVRQLDAFAHDRRKSPVMAPVAKALDPAQASAVARYFSSLPAAATPAPPRDAATSGALLAQAGRWSESRLPACNQCHGPDGSGVGDSFPPLLGQPAAYIKAQLVAWHDGARAPGPQALMKTVASKLSVADMDAISGYFGGAAPAAGAAPPAGTIRDAAQVAHKDGFTPPPESAIPDDEFGKLVRRGKAIFIDTKKNAAAFVGNDLNCVNCHLDAGRLAGSAPLWGAYVAYPQFRSKTGRIDDYADRLQGCFQFSMNGKAPPLGSDVLRALEAYSSWMATGAPVRTRMAGAGYAKVARPTGGGDHARGARLYEERCALCHGAAGAGQRARNVQVFPPLWGSRSFNWGAGMHQLNNAAAFVAANMPLGQGGTLDAAQAWDVAYFMDAHERPQDPRFTGSVAETRRKYHDSEDSLYGLTVKGQVLGAGR